MSDPDKRHFSGEMEVKVMLELTPTLDLNQERMEEIDKEIPHTILFVMIIFFSSNFLQSVSSI